MHGPCLTVTREHGYPVSHLACALTLLGEARRYSLVEVFVFQIPTWECLTRLLGPVLVSMCLWRSMQCACQGCFLGPSFPRGRQITVAPCQELRPRKPCVCGKVRPARGVPLPALVVEVLRPSAGRGICGVVLGRDTVHPQVQLACACRLIRMSCRHIARCVLARASPSVS